MNITFTHHKTTKRLVANCTKNNVHHFSVVINTAERTVNEAYEMAIAMLSRGGVSNEVLRQKFPIIGSDT